jgi:hypothetical protein
MHACGSSCEPQAQGHNSVCCVCAPARAPCVRKTCVCCQRIGGAPRCTRVARQCRGVFSVCTASRSGGDTPTALRASGVRVGARCERAARGGKASPKASAAVAKCRCEPQQKSSAAPGRRARVGHGGQPAALAVRP